MRVADLETCPCCGAPFRAFLFGQVTKQGWSVLPEWWRALREHRPMRVTTLICRACKEIVGHTGPDYGVTLEPQFRVKPGGEA